MFHSLWCPLALEQGRHQVVFERGSWLVRTRAEGGQPTDIWTGNLSGDIFPKPTGASVELEGQANHTWFLENQIKGGECQGQEWAGVTRHTLAGILDKVWRGLSH